MQKFRHNAADLIFAQDSTPPLVVKILYLEEDCCLFVGQTLNGHPHGLGRSCCAAAADMCRRRAAAARRAVSRWSWLLTCASWASTLERALSSSCLALRSAGVRSSSRAGCAARRGRRLTGRQEGTVLSMLPSRLLSLVRSDAQPSTLTDLRREQGAILGGSQRGED